MLISLSRARVKGFVRNHKKIMIGIIFFVLLIAVSLPFITKQYENYQASKVPTKEIAGGQVAHKNKIASLLAAPPAASASTTEKANYYDALRNAYASAENYQKATESFKTREALTTEGLDYADYFLVATYYDKIDDKAAGLAALDKAEKVIPAANDPENGYMRPELIEKINYVRQQLQ